MMSLDPETLEKLSRFQAQGDAGRAPYYQTLQAAKDPYGRLALSVVRQDLMAGRAAYSYALEVAKRYCLPISKKDWVDISIALMKDDFTARSNPDNFEAGSPSLKWFIIRNYHTRVFHDTAHLPPIVWTAWIPLYLQGESKDEKLWHRMLNEGFLKVGVETVALVLNHWAQKAGLSKELWNSVAPVLKNAPPVVTGSRPADPDFNRCMERLAPEQMTKNERLAAFYLDCLACALNLPTALHAPYGGPYGPSSGETFGDVGRLPFPF